MKTVNEIISRKKDLLKELKDPDKKKVKRAIKKLEQEKQDLMYLETNPSESFVKSEAERISRKLKILEDRFSEWAKGKSGGGRRIKEAVQCTYGSIRSKSPEEKTQVAA